MWYTCDFKGLNRILWEIYIRLYEESWMGLSNSKLFFVRHGDDNGVYTQNCRCNRENDDCISPLVTQHSYGKLHIYLWFTHSWFQMVYLIAMVVTFIWRKRHRFGENKNLAGKKQKWWWCSFICSLVMTNDLLQPAIKYLFSSCKAKKCPSNSMSPRMSSNASLGRHLGDAGHHGRKSMVDENSSKRLQLQYPLIYKHCNWQTPGFLPTHQLVGGFKPSWQILVNGKIIPYIVENKACSKPPTSQIQGGKEVTWPNFNSLQPWVWLVQSP